MSDSSGRRSDSTFKWLFFVGIVLIGALAGVTEEIKAAAIPIWFAAIGGVAFMMRGPLGVAIAERLTGRSSDPTAGLSEEALIELDELRRRVYELEERVDFSERLLASRPEAVRADVPEV